MPEPFAPSLITNVPSPAERTPLPLDGARADTRLLDAWCEWLGALATDAEAALAAAIAYRELDGGARDHWLSALEQDTSRLNVPRIAVYAPLLAVESDPDRRARITDAIGPADAAATPRFAPQGLLGKAADGSSVAVVISPLYLDFVQVLACSYRVERGFGWVRHDPIVDRRHALRHGERIDGTLVERTPLKSLIDELAHAVLAHKRSGRELPQALRVFADLFGPNISGSSPPPAT
ncbi:MAG TPA: hypothetical protein VHV51_10110 [Polyangiaceae bacterium]|jgi:hypothetical protein|nr:hypothetical protein [Polyangiaceae bacterium]